MNTAETDPHTWPYAGVRDLITRDERKPPLPSLSLAYAPNAFSTSAEPDLLQEKAKWQSPRRSILARLVIFCANGPAKRTTVGLDGDTNNPAPLTNPHNF